jgi:hypothetical protein
MNLSKEKALELVESRYYPLDPLYAVHVKLFIRTLRQLPCLSPSQGVYELNGHPITRVELCGTVVRRDAKG